VKTRDRSSTDATHYGTEVLRPASRASRHVGSRVRLRQRSFIVVASLVLSDALLALAVWEVTFLLRVALGLGLPSGATMAIVVPNTIAWVGVRAALGLYPGYGLGHVEELRRQTFALLATLAITTVFAFASEIVDSLSRLSLFAWALGLLVLAPVARYWVKRAMQRMGLWSRVLQVPSERLSLVFLLLDPATEIFCGTLGMARSPSATFGFSSTLESSRRRGTLRDECWETYAHLECLHGSE
jgi:multisubunit Na+/H+ antiporter MnhG subunit